MKLDSTLYFIALLPPQEIQDEITKIKHDFADNYDSRSALKSPPHITLYPPFEWPNTDLSELEQSLTEFVKVYKPIPLRLSGFAAFPPRVIYVDVIQTPELMQLYRGLQQHLATTLNLVDSQSQYRAFTPHITVAFHDLTKAAFKEAWIQYQTRSIAFECVAPTLTLLQHDGQRWQIAIEFRLGD
jgi:2'-5' RNA ligase